MQEQLLRNLCFCFVFLQLLGKGLKTCLDLCVQQSLCSVAFPVIGPGIALKYPITEATQVLTENIRQFGLSASSASLSTIHIVIKTGNPKSEEVIINICQLFCKLLPLRLYSSESAGVFVFSATMKCIDISART